MGMGQAAASLSEMINEEITLSIPRVLCLSSEELISTLNISSEDDICALTQSFQDNLIKAEAKLIFTEDKSLELVRTFLNRSVDLDELTDLEEDALLEIGNVIINSFVSCISDILKTQFEGTIPVLVKKRLSSLFVNQNTNLEEDKNDKVVIAGYVDFTIVSKEITGYLILLLDFNILELFVQNLLDSMVN